jgi:hypothetical protein
MATFACQRRWGGAAPSCPACEAANEIDDHLLGSAVELVTAFLVVAQQLVCALRRGSSQMTPPLWSAAPEFFASCPEFVAANAACSASAVI